MAEHVAWLLAYEAAHLDLARFSDKGPVADWFESEPPRHSIPGVAKDGDPVRYVESNPRADFVVRFWSGDGRRLDHSKARTATNAVSNEFSGQVNRHTPADLTA
ncbi:hypothetical protein [Halopiger goleimassiliensis]|uniref:hypothetical protein n=1 Tax=Halopiger goleimassiliensis TaxID=1293048 RepID=UPI0006778F7F|nr:hypothetical protein [Halopiger goleimassiliensis]